MSWDGAYNETRSVTVFRASVDKTIASWEKDGWELVARPPGGLRTELYFRRVAHRSTGAHARSRPSRTQALAGAAVLVVAVVAIVALTRGGDVTPPASAVDTTAPTQNPTTSATPATTQTPTPDPADEVLTVDDSADLAAVLAEPDACSDTFATFASTNRGRTIRIDANVAATAVRPGSTYDVVLRAGDFGAKAVGPAFALQGITVEDLHLAADSGRDYVSKGDDVDITAVLGTFDPDACFLRLVLESTDLR